MAPTEPLAETKRIKGKVEAEERRRVDDDAIEAFVWSQLCGDVASAREWANIVVASK